MNDQSIVVTNRNRRRWLQACAVSGVLVASVGWNHPAMAVVTITNASFAVSHDVNGLATSPIGIAFTLSKAANVTVTVKDSTSVIIRTLLNNAFRADVTISTSTVLWDGLTAGGAPAAVGSYTITITAIDPSDQSASAPATLAVPIESLAGDVVDYKSLFESSVYVYPNPVRSGQGTFQFTAVRDGATISLKIYTIDGTLVRSETPPSAGTAVPSSFVWDGTNQAGKKVGRGLYYYEVREKDPQGTLQVIKKMAVIP